MSKFKGTPTPWVVRELSLRVSVVGQNGEVVFHESDKRIPGAMDDARLIAAAPDLLSLLKEARSTLEMWKDVAPAVSLCADIDKALAKATGEEDE